ncbi:uncharacterized protein LOC111399104 [Olea europaea var. sylvestris]|uniref:uncharacterized protein LOC111399104 n=1 Tax=Olea europaea var. sylvestris TaxID=158386 RepID=UPI000C1D682F|nr:uncharacterized protein LOC111399104 [Olea europaea var. sylvestris]
MPMMEQIKNFNNNNKKEDGIAIHSQVRKIKQEIEKINHPGLQQLEMRPEIMRQNRSRSPLGVAKRPISVGD